MKFIEFMHRGERVSVRVKEISGFYEDLPTSKGDVKIGTTSIILRGRDALIHVEEPYLKVKSKIEEAQQ